MIKETPVIRLVLFISFIFLLACSPKDKTPLGNPQTKKLIDSNAFTAQVGIVAYTSLSDANQAAQTFDSKLASFMYHPNPMSQAEIQQAWRLAYDSFLSSLIFSYLPIQDPPDWYSQEIDYKRLLMQLDSWPIEGGYIDYIKEYPFSGIVNDLTLDIDEETIRSQHGFTDPTNASLGYHALEFMLWGNTGQRSTHDFFPQENTAPVPSGDGNHTSDLTNLDTMPQAEARDLKPQNHNRRRQYTRLLSELLQKDLHRIQRRWEPSSGYYAKLLQESKAENTLQAAFIAAQDLISKELLSKRFTLTSSEFSQTSNADLLALLAGLQQWFMPMEAELQEASLFFLIQQADSKVADNFSTALQTSTACIRKMTLEPADIDQCKQDTISLLSSVQDAAASLLVELPSLN
jgi:putative iron-regulated protein